MILNVELHGQDGSIIQIKVKSRPEIVEELTNFLAKIMEEEEITLELYEEVREVDHPMDTDGECKKKRRRIMLAP